MLTSEPGAVPTVLARWAALVGLGDDAHRGDLRVEAQGSGTALERDARDGEAPEDVLHALIAQRLHLLRDRVRRAEQLRNVGTGGLAAGELALAAAAALVSPTARIRPDRRLSATW